MSRITHIAVFLVALLSGTFLAGGYFMGSTWAIEESTAIDASPERILPYLATPRRWPEWTAWNPDEVTNLSMSHEGPESGPGAIQTWTDGEQTGRLEILEVNDEGVWYRLTMTPGDVQMACGFELDAGGSSTRVTWRCNGDVGRSYMARWMMFFFQPLIERDFQAGLEKLETVTEEGGIT